MSLTKQIFLLRFFVKLECWIFIIQKEIGEKTILKYALRQYIHYKQV